MAEPERKSGRRTFGPVVLLGLATAAMAAVASAKPWIGSTSGGGDASLTALDAGTRYPLASAVSLVLLASWGVLLVTRGRVRRVFAVVALVAAVGLVVCVVAAHTTLPDSAASSFDQLMGRSQDQGFTGWFWTAAVSSVLAVVPAALAVRLVPTWPEMGSRYDAPATREQAAEPEPTGEQDLWKALDEGRDPTDTNTP
jgi:uncharacterized membrane protein (TIGR02234 family)